MEQEDIVICGQCDLVLALPKARGGLVGICPRCHNTLYHFHSQHVMYSLCYALTALIFMIASDFLPFISISNSGITQEMEILDYTRILFEDEMGIVSISVYFFMQFLPLIALTTIIGADVCFFKKKKNKVIVQLLKIYKFCLNWSMVEVFMVGILVSLIKLVSLVDINYGYGFWCFSAFSVFYLLAIRRFNFDKMWNYYAGRPILTRIPMSGFSAEYQEFAKCDRCGYVIDGKSKNGFCLRCGCKIKDKSVHSISKCLALVFAALCMYIPANIYPMMITTYLGVNEPSTIIDGVIVLWGMKSYFVASVILIASICIPILKIIILLFLCFYVRKIRKIKNKRLLSFIYRVVEFIGKWSMIDVFVVAIMATIVRIGNLMVIYPGSAVFSFAIVVVLTMLAARQFDPRLLWYKRVNNEFKNAD